MSGANDVSEGSLGSSGAGSRVGRHPWGVLQLSGLCFSQARTLDWLGWVYSRNTVGFPQSIIATFAEAFKCREVELIQATEKQVGGWWWGANQSRE